MLMVSGSVQNAVKMDMLNNKWEQKKNSGDILSKQELNERANWTQEDWMKNDYEEQLAREKEANKKTEIANKIASGQKLTQEEEQYLSTYDPQGLADYRQTQSERKAYEEKLKNCKTKDEVQKLKTTTLGNELASLKKVINNPYIPLSEKLKKAQQALGKTRNIQEAEEKFVESGAYEKLPTEAEEAIDRAKEDSLQHEIDSARMEDNAKAEDEEKNVISETPEDLEYEDKADDAAMKLEHLEQETKQSATIGRKTSEDTVKEIENIYNQLHNNRVGNNQNR